MKRGTQVAVCHDGKWGRRVQGEVVATRNGHHVKVRFPHPMTGSPVEFWVRKRPAVRYRRERTTGCITTIRLKSPASFAGWADIEYFCPWFAVYPWPKTSEADS